MTRQEHLLIRAMEECNEVAQRLSKALIFGEEETQVGQPLTNRQRIMEEFTDLLAVLAMAGYRYTFVDPAAVDRKIAKVERYLRHSVTCGTLEEETR